MVLNKHHDLGIAGSINIFKKFEFVKGMLLVPNNSME